MINYAFYSTPADETVVIACNDYGKRLATLCFYEQESGKLAAISYTDELVSVLANLTGELVPMDYFDQLTDWFASYTRSSNPEQHADDCDCFSDSNNPCDCGAAY